ncbi:MAG: ATP-binding protein, partial [Actinomycetota bacterium]|nr:ATP-binding protein [Actinomycetota bacterium]
LMTVAAFLNSREGGTLLIGVADDGSVFGLDSDHATLRKPGKDERDLFSLHLNQALINSVGMAATANVSQEILEVGGKDLCRVHVKPSSFPVEATVVEVDKNGQHVKKNSSTAASATAPARSQTSRSLRDPRRECGGTNCRIQIKGLGQR